MAKTLFCLIIAMILNAIAATIGYAGDNELRDAFWDMVKSEGEAGQIHFFEKFRGKEYPDGYIQNYIYCDRVPKSPCIGEQAEFAFELEHAYEGNYQSQRNVAYCLLDADGCNAVYPNYTLGCAWRMLILVSGSPEITGSDLVHLKQRCAGILSPAEFEVAKLQAARLYNSIYLNR